MIDQPRRQHYQVPRRFGLRSILVATALFGAMLAILKWTEMSPVPFVFYFSYLIVVGGAQAIFERNPRLASILGGSSFVLILKLAAAAFSLDLHTINVGLFEALFSADLATYPLAIVFGGFYGYLIGTMLAGLYLVLDTIQFLAKWPFRQDRMSTGVSP